MAEYVMSARTLIPYPLGNVVVPLEPDWAGADPTQYYPNEDIPVEKRRAVADVVQRNRNAPFQPSAETLKRAGCDYPQSLLMRLRMAAENGVDKIDPKETLSLAFCTLSDHVCLAEGFQALVDKVADLELSLNRERDLSLLRDKELAEVKEDSARQLLAAKSVAAQAQAQLTELQNKGAALPLTSEPVHAPSEAIAMLGRIPPFASDQESKMTFDAWAKLFVEHATLRNLPPSCWVAVAKTNLSGSARARWNTVEASMSVSVPTWDDFVQSMTPMFASADRKLASAKAWNRAVGRECQLDLKQLQDFGRTLVGLFTDMGPVKPITTEGAVDAYLKCLPIAVRGVIAMDKRNNPEHYSTLDGAVTRATGLLADVVPTVAAVSAPDTQERGRQQQRGKQPARKPSEAGSSAAQTSSQSKKQKSGSGPQPADTRTREQLMADPAIAGHSQATGGKRYDKALWRLCIAENLCLECKQKGHSLANCPVADPAVKTRMATKYAAKN